MAENNIPINIEVSGAKGINDAADSLKKYRQELKAAQAAALNGDGQAAKRVAELKDKMDDLRDSTKTMQGSGVEKISSSFSMLFEGFSNFDGDKIKTAFTGIGAAMKAIPIFLIAEGVRYLVENFDELSEGNGILAKSLRALGEVFSWIGDKITEFTDTLGLSNSALDKMGETVQTNAEKSKEALALQNAEYDRQIMVAKAAGKSTVEVEKAKQEAIIKTNYEIAKQIEAYVRAGGVLDEEKKKILNESLTAIKNAKAQEFVIEQNHNKQVLDDWKKLQTEKLNAYNKSIDDRIAAENALLAYEKYLQTIRVDMLKMTGEEHKAMAEQDLKVSTETEFAGIAMVKEALSQKKRTLRDYWLTNKEEIAQSLQLEHEALIATQSLSDMVFAIKMGNLKKGSAEEEKAAKRQFQVNKALQLATAAINGAQAVTAILSVPDFTWGVQSAIRIAAAVAATGATIAKIATTKFEGGGSGGDVPSGGGGGGMPNLGGGAPTPPSFTPPQNQTTMLNENGEVINRTVKAVVVETDITSKQDRVNRLENQSTF